MKSQRAHLITGSNAPTSNLTEAWDAITLLLFGIFELTLGPKTLSSFGTWWISFHLDKFLLAKLMWQSGGSFADSKLDRLVASPVNSYQHSILLHSLVVGGSSRHLNAPQKRGWSHIFSMQHRAIQETWFCRETLKYSICYPKILNMCYESESCWDCCARSRSHIF